MVCCVLFLIKGGSEEKRKREEKEGKGKADKERRRSMRRERKREAVSADATDLYCFGKPKPKGGGLMLCSSYRSVFVFSQPSRWNDKEWSSDKSERR